MGTGQVKQGEGVDEEGTRPSRPSLTAIRSKRLRRLARARRFAAFVLLLAPAMGVVAVDVGLRGARLAELPSRYVGSYFGAFVESTLLWGLLLFAASARRGLVRWVFATLFVLLSTLAVGAQTYFHGQYATYLNLDATLWGTSLSESLLGQVSSEGVNLLLALAGPAACATVAVMIGRRVVRPARRVRLSAFVLAPIAVVAVFLVPCSYRSVQASTPDVIYFHAIGGLVKELTGVRTTAQIRPGRRNPPQLAHVAAKPAAPRNVVFILTESVRADAHCSVPTDDCAISPKTNVAASGRLPLTQLRSNSSTTAIQLAVLWSGLQPTESREALHAAPLVFDYANAAGIDTAYWTSHHMMFANSRLWVQDLPTRFQCGATDLDPLADIDTGGDDDLLVARVKAELPQLREPFFATVHIGNTHVPYRVDPERSPFSPSVASKAPEDNDAYHNYYKNAVHLQDEWLGDLVAFLREGDRGARTVIVFTSDHGEAFREHSQLGHTGSILEEEIHVPGWVIAPPGTLTDEERRNLEAKTAQPIFHTDVTPTILDLLGLYEEPTFATHRAAMPGASWLRPAAPPAPLFLSNCSGVWGCAFRNWGVMQGTLKLEGREWDESWHCYDVAADPHEKNDLGEDACAELRGVAQRVYGGPPGQP
jgi:glucan phosphoethanolaminetransferase (alkaline phosphatase superfamily)